MDIPLLLSNIQKLYDGDPAGRMKEQDERDALAVLDGVVKILERNPENAIGGVPVDFFNPSYDRTKQPTS